ncbi:hypothetical protein BJX99DRAFT_254257 [Aspergillus californicus]
MLHFPWHAARDPQAGGYLKALVRTLIDAGVPFNERTVSGNTTLDKLIRSLYLDDEDRREGPPPFNPWLGVLDMLLTSGGYLNSVVAAKNNWAWSFSASQAARFLLQNNYDGFEFLEIEIAILSRSAMSLERCLMTQDYHHTNDVLVTRYFTLLDLCLGWPEGLVILLESPLRHLYPTDPDDPTALDDRIGDCFEDACDEGEIECALILVKYIECVDPEHLRAAARRKDVAILTEVISALADARRKLQQLALECLPHQDLCLLSLPTSALLDTKAFDVYEKLESYGIEVQPCFYDRPSIYGFAEFDIAIFERLYEAGFTDFKQCDADSVTTLMVLPWYDYESPPAPFSFINGANWLVCRGASLYQLSPDGFPSSFYLARCFGHTLRVWYRLPQGRREGPMSLMEKQHVDAKKFFCLLMTDGNQDDCLCTCSTHGCTSIQQTLRGFYTPWPDRVNERTCIIAITAMIDGLLAFSPEPVSDDQKLNIVQRILRYITFEALELTHTCHIKDDPVYFEWDEMTFKRMDAGDVLEVREEEATLIHQLDQLMAEFSQKYNELGLDLHDFIREYWKGRLDEVLTEEVDPEEAERVRALGAILT